MLFRSDLRKRGIPSSMAERIAAEAERHAERDPLADALDHARRHAGRMASARDRETWRRRLYGYLSRRGFSARIIHEVLRVLEAEAE